MKVLPFILLSACSLSEFNVYKCQENTECTNAFGYGFQCGDSGYCETYTNEDKRCSVFPNNLGSEEFGATYGQGIPIGVIFNSDQDQPSINGAKIAMTDVLDASSSDASPYFFVECDIKNDRDNEIDGLDESDALQYSLDHLITHFQVSGIVGLNRSDLLSEAYTQTESNILFLSPNADGDFLKDIDGSTTPEEPGLIWQIQPSNLFQISQLVNRLFQFNKRSVYAIYENSIYADEFLSTFNFLLPPEGTDLEITLQSCQLNGPLNNENQCTSSLRGEFYDTIVMISSNPEDHWGLINQLNEMENFRQNVQVFLDGTGRNQGTLDLLTPKLDGKIFGVSSRVTNSSPLYESFYSQYAGQNNLNDIYDSPASIFAHDAIWMMAMAHSHAHINGEISASTLGIGLHNLNMHEEIGSGNGDMVELSSSGWIKAKSSFEDGLGVNISGVSGHLDYNPETEQNDDPISHGIQYTREEGIKLLMVCQGHQGSNCADPN